MDTAEQLVTADEYLQGEAQHFVELIDGQVVMDEPTVWHQGLCGHIYHVLSSWADASPGRGAAFIPVNVRLDERNVFGPDISWLREERRPDPSTRWIGAPDLVVEVRSSSTWHHDIGHKRRYYERFGVSEMWLVDGFAESVICYRRSSPDVAEFDVSQELSAPAELTSPLLPGFALSLGKLFEPQL